MQNELERVSDLVAPIAADLDLDLYDVERRGGTVRVTLDTPPGSEHGINLETLSLATRLISRELDHEDPINGRYTLEVTSPGLERTLRTPAHFRREVGKDVLIRLREVAGDDRRVRGVLVAADDEAATVRTESGEERRLPYATIDKARTVFEWGPAPKPGSTPSANRKRRAGDPARGGKADAADGGQSHGGPADPQRPDKEKQPS